MPIVLPDHALPDHATEASRRRAALALELARSCPSALADEIALTGSTARGFADDDSDLELNLWAQELPPLDARIGWLRAAGARDLHVEAAPRPDDSHWIQFRLDNLPAEVGCQTFDALQAQIEHMLSGATIERKALAFGDILTSAIPLRTAGRLPAWQSALNAYSDAVQRGIVQMAVACWARPDHLPVLRRLARHNERLALTESLLADLDMALRLLYAAHRRWEPSRKWTLSVARGFAPFDLDARIDAILGDPSLERRVDLCAQFCMDVLVLVPEQYDVAAAVAALRG